MKILVVEPNKRPYEQEISGSLESMQSIVNGLIEAIYPFLDEVALVCNDEGKILNLSLNRYLCRNGSPCDYIAGTFFLCSTPSDSDSFQSLSDEQIEKYTKICSDIFIEIK